MNNFDEIIDRSHTGSMKWKKYENTDILPFWVADMDFKAPAEVIEAMGQCLNHGVFGYTLAETSCLEAVMEYLDKNHGWEIQPEWIVWTPGLVPALNMACRAFAEPGDGIMTMTPMYYPILFAPEYANQELQEVPLVLNATKSEWEIDFDTLEASVHDRTKVFILSNPHNPVGKVFSREEMQRLVEFVLKHDILLCSDEIHCDLILNAEKKHVCAGVFGEDLYRNLIVMQAPSKTYNLAGMACAFLIIPDPAVRAKYQQTARGVITEVNCLGYAACESAYRNGETWRQELIAYLEENRRYLYEFVEANFKAFGIKMYPMDATYLAWIDLRELELPSPAQYFETFGIGLSEGAAFHGDGFVRLNFGCPKSMLVEGLNRMKKGLARLKSHE